MSNRLANEIGTYRTKWKDQLPVALLYPNTYPVAVSNLGYQLVYTLLNSMDGVVCERFVYPESGEEYRSLESSRPLSDFPLVFGSISFEHDFPRLAAMLAAGGVAPYSDDRGPAITAGEPLVVLGGVGVFMNPEPLASFADLMVIGEAEGVLAPLMTLLEGYAQSERTVLLKKIAMSLPGCYVPQFYHLHYDELGRVETIEVDADLPPRVHKVIAPKMERAAHSTLLSPDAELGMYMVELGRGCSRGCRFCAAGFIYRPPRLWSADAILAGLEDRPEAVDRIGLLGMEMASSATVDKISRYLQENNCALSFSSLRADRISEQTLTLLAASNLKSVAIAADGASERLRELINKGLKEEDLLSAGERLVAAGIFHLKLYVMIGLPSETQEDLEELVQLVEKLQARILPIGRERGRVSELTLSINCFVPKPWTPFQYCGFGGLEEQEATKGKVESAVKALKRKIRFLRQGLSHLANLQLKFDHPEQALQQAVFSRADRHIAPALLDIGLGKAGFKQAMRQHNLDSWQYAVRPRSVDEIMCWEVLDHGIRPGHLFQECQRALAGQYTHPCEPAVCRRCGVCGGEQ
ncbi:radical SAM protein [Desulfobulbus rhabdoformis]|uniref:radical SAM protein n=1 Tax=Desulfobulbus rhabdoformis TaxID=34032 RepID=UPI00308429F4